MSFTSFSTDAIALIYLPDGFDEDSVADELTTTDAEQTQLLEFIEDDLDNFPYGKKDPGTELKRKQFILNLIVNLSKNPNFIFGATQSYTLYVYYHWYTLCMYTLMIIALHSVDQDSLHKVTPDVIKRTQALYAKEVPQLWESGMQADGVLVHVLAIGQANGCDYLLNLGVF